MNNEKSKSIAGEEKLETNPLFPSGEWEGFYTHEFGPHARRHLMSFTLTFKNGTVSGSGIDDINYFSWRGKYDTEKLRCWMQKLYPSHLVFYDGHVDENGIWGSWEIPPYYRGGFHLWPKGAGENIAVSDKEAVPKSAVVPGLITI